MPNFLRKTAITILWIILSILFLATTVILLGWLLIGNEYTSIFGYETILGVNLAALYENVGKYINYM